MRTRRTEREENELEKMKEFDLEKFQKKFPNLFKEIKNNTQSIKIDGVRTNPEEAEKASKSKKKDPEPNLVDYIRLCDNKEEALKIIDYMEREERVEPKYAEKIRNQLKNRGLRSFGSKRRPGKYPSTQQTAE